MAARGDVIVLGPSGGLHHPDYQLDAFKNGDPRKIIPSSKVDLRTVTSISTSKSIADLAGTFTITLKDGRAQHELREMDVIRIKLRGHGDARLIPVLTGVVDSVGDSGDAQPTSSQEDIVITGRCVAKYLQVTSLFLPVWDPSAALPTVLTFGLGDPTNKAGGTRPYDIFRYLIRRYTYGSRTLAGLSGIPNSRFWLDHYSRFSKSHDFQVPFLQFDENSVGEALTRLEVLGYTETFVDELGRVVYRHPGWDQAVRYRLSTEHLINDNLTRSDVDTATYVEVIPAGAAGIDPGVMQALAAGRAPVPSSYLSAASGSGGLAHVSPEFVVQTNAQGIPTAKGRQNPWYRLQRRIGLRPQQISSPLLATQAQAQAQAEGLLRFAARMTKGGTVILPGDPRVRIGTTIQIYGELKGRLINRIYYIEAVAHDLQWGGEYTTTLTLSHGRDPWDPKWRQIALPQFSAADLAASGGVLGGPITGTDSTSGGNTPGNVAALPTDASMPSAIQALFGEMNRMALLGVAYLYGGGHSGYTSTGPWDCSGAVSQALHVAGLLSGGPLTSGQLASWASPGGGNYFTVWANAAHTFIEIPAQGLCWGTTSAGAGGGVAFHQHPTNGFVARHASGL